VEQAAIGGFRGGELPAGPTRRRLGALLPEATDNYAAEQNPVVVRLQSNLYRVMKIMGTRRTFKLASHTGNSTCIGRDFDACAVSWQYVWFD